MISFTKKLILLLVEILTFPFFIISILILKIIIKKSNIARLVWGPIPILNNSYWSKSMKINGFNSFTYTYNYYQNVNKRNDWDIILDEKYLYFHSIFKPYIAFLDSMLKYDIFFIPFSGYFLGFTRLWFIEAFLFKLFNKKTVLLPYGADAYVYNRTKSTTLNHALLLSYPNAGINQKKIQRKVDYWIQHADLIIAGIMGPDGLGRWDVLIPSILFIDLDLWKPSKKVTSNKNIKIVHTPNHKGFKGTEFIINAINELKNEGLDVELLLIENKQNEEVRYILENEADILIEQIVAPGHALSALEGMSSGLPVISNLDDDQYLLPFRRWSYFSECPIVSANPENIKLIIKNLINDSELRYKLGLAGRKYVEKYHGLDSAHYLFKNCIDLIYYNKISKEKLLNLYHPLKNSFINNNININNPLKNNKIV
jgi:hypothetical protein